MPPPPSSAAPCFPKMALACLCTSLLLLAGLWARHAAWATARERDFPPGADWMGLSTLDGSYYLRLATDPPAGERDPLRAHPAGRPTPHPLPLLPRVARTALGLGLSESLLIRHLPAWIGALLILPAYGLGRACAGPTVGLCAAVLMAVNPALLDRTSLGRFDTDGLILLFCMTGLASLWRLGRAWESGSPLRPALLGWGASLILAFWTWDQAPDAVLAFFTLSSAGLLPLVWRVGRTRKAWPTRPALVLATGLLAGLAYTAFQSDIPLLTRLVSRLHYVSQTHAVGLDIGLTIGEQAGLSWHHLALSQGGILPSTTALAGLALLAWREKRSFLILLPCLLLGTWGALNAARFALFAAPMFALGNAVLCAAIARRCAPRRLPALAPGLAAVLALPGLSIGLDLDWKPSTYPASRRVLHALGKHAGGAGLVHAWWDSGYEIQSQARLPTAADGGWRTREWLNAMSLALCAPDDPEALRRLREAAPPPKAGAEWVWIDPPTLRAFPWILRLAAAAAGHPGTRDFTFRPFFNVTATADGWVTGSDGLRVQLHPWNPEAAGKIALASMPTLTLGNETLQHPDHVLVANLPRGVAALVDKALLSTFLVRLCYLEDVDARVFQAGPREGASGGWKVMAQESNRAP